MKDPGVDWQPSYCLGELKHVLRQCTAVVILEPHSAKGALLFDPPPSGRHTAFAFVVAEKTVPGAW